MPQHPLAAPWTGPVAPGPSTQSPVSSQHEQASGAKSPRWGQMSLTQRRSVGYQDIHAFRNEVPFLEQRLAAWEVKTPAVKPGLPVGEEQGVQSWPLRVGAMRVRKGGHPNQSDTQDLTPRRCPPGWGFKVRIHLNSCPGSDQSCLAFFFFLASSHLGS